MVPPDHALPHRAHEEDRPLPPPPSRTDPQLFPGSKAAVERRRRGPQQQGQSHHEKILRLPHLPRPRTCPLSLTWQAAGTAFNPRFLLTSLKFLVPVARQSLEDCQRMATIFAEQHCDTREAGQLYATWRRGSAAIRKRILDDPALFFKTQRQAQEKASSGAGAELVRDLEMVTAILNRVHRRLAGAEPMELDHPQRAAVRQQIERIEKQLRRIDEKLLPEPTHVESGTTDH